MEGFDDIDPDSDYDYEETYKKRKKRGGPGKPPKNANADSPHAKKGPKVCNSKDWLIVLRSVKITMFQFLGY